VVVLSIWAEIRKTITVVVTASLQTNRTASANAVVGEVVALNASSKKRMCRIAALVGGLQIVTMVTNIWTSTQLEVWTEKADLRLQCQLENRRFRNWDSYGLYEGSEICAAGEETWNRAGACQTACVYNPNPGLQEWATETDLTCDSGVSNPLHRVPHSNRTTLTNCDCDCSDIVNLQAPSLGFMCLSYFSQSFVACVVGVCLGFRKPSLDGWRSAYSSYSASSGKKAPKPQPVASGEYSYSD
jgi:hypothetical protein